MDIAVCSIQRRQEPEAESHERGRRNGDDTLARIRGPVGLNIAAVTAPEIALSILAEFVAVRRNATPK